MNKNILFIASIIVGVAIGYGISHFTNNFETSSTVVLDAGQLNTDTAVNASSNQTSIIRDKNIVSESASVSGVHYSSVAEVMNEPVGFPRYYALYQLANVAQLDALPELIRQSLALRENFYRTGFTTVFLEKFTYLDPEAAFNFVRPQVTSPLSPNAFMLQIVFREWVRLDQQAAIAALDSVGDPQLRQNIVMTMVQDPNVLDPAARNQLLSKLPQENRHFVQSMQLQQLPPAQAFEEALKMQDSGGRLTAANLAIGRWVREDPIAALERIQLLASETNDSMLNHRILMNMALRTWANSDFDSAYAYAEISEQRSELIPQLLTQLVNSNPERAVELARNFQTDNGGNDRTLYTVLSNWAASDVNKALNYVNENGIALDRNLEARFASIYAQQKPMEAIAWIEGRGEHLAISVGNIFGSQHPEEAERYINNLKSGVLRDSIVQSLAQRKAQTNPESALDWLERNLSAESRQYDIVKNQILQQWISRDVERSVAYLQESNQPLNESYVPIIVNRWYSKDPQAASRWIEKLPAGPQKNQAWTTYAQSVGVQTQNFDTALTYTNNINDEQVRNAAVAQIVRLWVLREPQREEELIQRYNLDPEQVKSTSPGFFQLEVP